jgi:hypothetical protein
MDLGFDIWKSVVIGYTSATTLPTYMTEKNESENDAKYMNAILCRLLESIFFKVMQSTKEIWDKIQNIHEEDEKVNKVKLQTHRI